MKLNQIKGKYCPKINLPCDGDQCARFNKCRIEYIRSYFEFIETMGISVSADERVQILKNAGFGDRIQIIKTLFGVDVR